MIKLFMQKYEQRLEKFIQEREELRLKMKQIKEPLRPLQRRLEQVSKNIGYLKCMLKNKK